MRRASLSGRARQLAVTAVCLRRVGTGLRVSLSTRRRAVPIELEMLARVQAQASARDREARGRVPAGSSLALR
jgi:hypothetical protein